MFFLIKENGSYQELVYTYYVNKSDGEDIQRYIRKGTYYRLSREEELPSRLYTLNIGQLGNLTLLEEWSGQVSIKVHVFGYIFECPEQSLT